MNEKVRRKTATKAGDEENRIEVMDTNGAAILKAQIAWLLLLADNVVDNLKAPMSSSTVTTAERTVEASRGLSAQIDSTTARIARLARNGE